MPSVNKAIIIGHLGRDPEIRNTKSGQEVANFSVATTEKWTGKDKQKQESTEWHSIVAWGAQATYAQGFLQKGDQVYIEGRLQTRSWDDKDGVKKYTTEIVAYQIQGLGKREQKPQAPAQAQHPEAGTYEEDDIPF